MGSLVTRLSLLSPLVSAFIGHQIRLKALDLIEPSSTGKESPDTFCGRWLQERGPEECHLFCIRTIWKRALLSLGHPIWVLLMQVAPHKTPSGMLSVVQRGAIHKLLFLLVCLTLNCGFWKNVSGIKNTQTWNNSHSSSCRQNKCLPHHVGEVQTSS